MAIQEAVNKAITTGASFLLASQELKNRRAKVQKAQMQTYEELARKKKQEAETVASQKKRDEAAIQQEKRDEAARQKIRENLADQRMLDELARKKQEAEAVKARSEEFRKLVMEGIPQYGHGPKEVIRYGN